MYKDYDNYRTYENDDLSAGATLKVEHTIIVNETDILNLISQPLEKIQAMRDNNVKKETAAFEKVRQSARDWEKKAAITRQFDRAIEYLQVPEVSHSSNKWVNDRDCYNYDCTSISNMVYKMTYRMYDYTSWRSEKTRRWEVKWSIGTNSPVGHNNCIAEQERSFKDKAEAEKFPRPFRKNMKNPLWYTNIFYPDMLQRKCKKLRKRQRRKISAEAQIKSRQSARS